MEADPILKELWEIKDGLAEECNHDLRRLFERLKESQKSHGTRLVNRAKNRGSEPATEWDRTAPKKKRRRSGEVTGADNKLASDRGWGGGCYHRKWSKSVSALYRRGAGGLHEPGAVRVSAAESRKSDWCPCDRNGKSPGNRPDSRTGAGAARGANGWCRRPVLSPLRPSRPGAR